ncbi:hypothetical protein Taro_027730 [Colocasia esculenta]|uniref:SIAH-type domain-containing protein n=1 Tax=Colocasia esculenta TaxID=4460 RepID=A0A843VKZ9_COLES|nr:hypothetical protein [Colocasia esculenta]
MCNAMCSWMQSRIGVLDRTQRTPIRCKNGHIACSSCCTKMKKCHSCLCPIGPSRCLALENVIESIKVPCPFARNGCRERVGYTQRNLHKQACLYSPCCCPISECAFAGSLKQLSHHFRIRHGDRAIFFMYNVPFMISTGRSEPFQVLLAEDGVLFLLLNNSGAPVGNAVTITLIGPDTLKGAFSYRLIARSTESSIQIESCVTNTKRWDGVFPSKDFLLIPQDFCGMQGVLCLDICVRNKRK